VRINHVILYVPGEDTWLECTSSNFPPSYLGSRNAGRNVLLITPQGGRFHRTPDLDRTKNVETFAIAIDLAATGVATVRVQQTSTGADHEWYRHMADHYSAEEQRKWLQQSSSLPSFSIESMQVAADPGRPVSELDYQVRVPRYAAQAGKRIFVPLNGVHPFNQVPEEVEERRLPVVRKRGYIERDTVRLRLPEGYQVESMPESPVTYESDFGAYRLDLKKEDDALHLFRTLDIKAGEWPPERYGAFRDFFRDISKAEGWKIVLVKK
jgi:hypothetical protein